MGRIGFGKGLALTLVIWIFAWQNVSTLNAEEPSVVIENCSIFEPSTGELLTHRTIVIAGQQIVRVATVDEAVDIPSTAIRVDASGKFALPGLIDSHVHVVHVLVAHGADPNLVCCC